MKRFGTIVALLLASAATAQAQVPQLISYQGVLTDNAGTLVPDGNYDITFRFFDSATGGTALHQEKHAGVPVSRGGFSVLIGSDPGVPLTLPFSIPYWLEIQVAPDAQPLSPRIQLASSPYAQMAETVLDDAITSAKIATGAVTSTDILDNTIVAGDVAPNIVSSVDGVANDGGNIDLVAGSGVTITPDDFSNRITIAGVAPSAWLSGFLNTRSASVTGNWTRIDNFLTFTKADASSVIEVALHSRAYSGFFAGGAEGIHYALRIDDVESSISGQAAITESNATHFVSCAAVFTGLAAGSHTVSVWARTGPGAFTSSSGVVLDPGGWGGRIIVKELH